MAFYRATGQAHKPSPPLATGKSSVVTKKEGGIASFIFDVMNMVFIINHIFS